MATPTVYTPKPLADPGQLGTTVGDPPYLHTVSASTTTKLTAIILVNDTTTSVTATIYLTPSGTEGVTNLLLNAVDIPTNGTPLILEFDELYLNATATIEGLASVANQVTYHLSGVELT